MRHKNNTIRLNETELQHLVENIIQESINEMNWKKGAKTVAKGLGVGTTSALLGWAALEGLENNIRYSDSVNRQGAAMNTCPQKEYIKQHNLDPNDPRSWDEADMVVGDEDPVDYYNQAHPQTNESKRRKRAISENHIARAIRQSLRQII